MKKSIFFTLILLISLSTYCQDTEIGYRTTDVGGEFQWYPNGFITGLHFGFNAKIHHSIQLRFNYNKTDRGDKGENDEEKGTGLGGGIGYRYYFKPFPHKFFIGFRSDLWKMSIDWKEGTLVGSSDTWTVQPALEIGYTFFINDQAFLTPSIANGSIINIKTDGQKVGQGYVLMAGISAGVRF